MPFRFSMGKPDDDPWYLEGLEDQRLVGLARAAHPRLDRMAKKHGDTYGLVKLLRAGWPIGIVVELVDAWPHVGDIRLQGLFGYANSLAEAGIEPDEDVIGWTHAMCQRKGGSITRRDVVIRMGMDGTHNVKPFGFTCAPFVRAYLSATATHESALLAVAAGLTISQAQQLTVSDSATEARLRQLAAQRHVPLR